MKIPIVFSFNDKYTIPAGVCITSLLINAKEGVLFDIHIFYSGSRLSKDNISKIKKLENHFSNCTIQFIDINNAFENEYEVRNLSIESYFRLLIPKLLKHYPTVLYSDVDIVFNRDISELFKIDLSNHPIAGAPEYPNNCNPLALQYMNKLNLNPKNYVNAGVLLFNNDLINADGNYYQKLPLLVGKKFDFLDQDILNTIFAGNIKFFPATFNYSINTLLQDIHIVNPHVIHYTLSKPWNNPKMFGDVWWDYYKESIFYDEAEYFSYLKENYEHFELLINIGRQLKKYGFYRLYYFIKRFQGAITSRLHRRSYKNPFR